MNDGIAILFIGVFTFGVISISVSLYFISGALLRIAAALEGRR